AAARFAAARVAVAGPFARHPGRVPGRRDAPPEPGRPDLRRVVHADRAGRAHLVLPDQQPGPARPGHQAGHGLAGTGPDRDRPAARARPAAGLHQPPGPQSRPRARHRPLPAGSLTGAGLIAALVTSSLTERATAP